MGKKRWGTAPKPGDNTPVRGEEDEFMASLLQVGPEHMEAPAEPVGLPIVKIWPDPAQPRRVMPEDLRARWCRGEDIQELLAEWEQRAIAAVPEVASWRLLLTPGNDPTPADEEARSPWDAVLPPVAARWVELVKLAASIHDAGLAQPIVVYPAGKDSYRVQVGERRLLAHHLLRWASLNGYDHISAIKREGPDLWRQAYENGMRRDLNAIGLARQLALLLLALNGRLKPPEGQPDHGWYAQAAELRVPKGKMSLVTTLLGAETRMQVSRYRALLDLPDEVWELADAHDWAEGKIRTLVERSQGDCNQLVTLARIEAGLEPREQPIREDRMARKATQAVTALKNWKDDDIRALSRQAREALIAEAEAFIQRLRGGRR